MRIFLAAMAVAALGMLPAESVQAQTSDITRVQASDVSAQSRRPRARVRIYRNDDIRGVYPRYNPGPNAVRECTANLVQEFRPSGTVIVPRMNCFWRRG